MGEVAPGRIWLQWDLDDDPVNEQTWCVDKINDSDAEYVRANEIERLLEKNKKIIKRCNLYNAKTARLQEALARIAGYGSSMSPEEATCRQIARAALHRGGGK